MMLSRDEPLNIVGSRTAVSGSLADHDSNNTD